MQAADGKNRKIQAATMQGMMTKEWSGKTVAQYKDFKGLKKENLRDNNIDDHFRDLTKMVQNAKSRILYLPKILKRWNAA
jgi:hypothetical protein